MTDPYCVPGPACINFSGGRTSAYLLKQIINAYGGDLPEDVVVVFANTGKEHPATLNFVRDCEHHWGVKITWVEFDKDAPHQTRVVDHSTASRDGRPLKEIVDTRPTPHLFNPVSRYCSQTAKARRIGKYAHKWLGWKHWTSIVGLRADEPRRAERLHKRTGKDRSDFATPLVDAGVTKEDVAEFWRQQNFDLRLPNVGGVTPLGNCVLCPLKSKRKLVNAIRANPEEARWWIEREREMTERIKGTHPHGDPNKPERRNRFFKDGTSYEDLELRAWKEEMLEEPYDDGFDPGIDCMCTD